jgi:endonuclease YncB( thermonuclease family)
MLGGIGPPVLVPALASLVVLIAVAVVLASRAFGGRASEAGDIERLRRALHAPPETGERARAQPEPEAWARRSEPVPGYLPTPRPFSGRAWVVDGDTITVERHRVRLFGMDAPELDQDGGKKAKAWLIRLVRKGRVKVEPLCFDQHGRIVAKVWHGDIDVSERMVLDGYAVAMSGWHRDYNAAELEARSGNRGLWAFDGIADPSDHRRRRRLASDGPAAEGRPG